VTQGVDPEFKPQYGKKKKKRKKETNFRLKVFSTLACNVNHQGSLLIICVYMPASIPELVLESRPDACDRNEARVESK
jgi:hypothetical protein